MEYLAIAEKYTDFKITKDGMQIATLNYKNWFKFNAEIEISNSKYLVEPIGFGEQLLKFLMGKRFFSNLRLIGATILL